MEKNISRAMDEFYQLVNCTPPTDAAEKLTRLAATMPASTAIPALARLYVLTMARARYDQAKLLLGALSDEREPA